MAGIGFELKKIFKGRSLWSALKGAFYSTFTVIGPMLIIMVCYFLLFIIMGYQNIGYDERDLITSIVLYVFIFSLIFTSPISAVVSRYIADKIFEEKYDDVMPSYYAGLLINVLVGQIFCVPFIIMTAVKSDADPTLLLLAGSMFISLIFVFYSMTFISALKEYKSIALSFTAGMVVTMVVSYVLYNAAGLSFSVSIMAGMASGFLFIAFTLFALIKLFFRESSSNYREFFSYLNRYKLLLFTNLLYICGLYVHNFVYWNIGNLSIVIAGTMRSAPVFDTATFLAMMTNVSATVIFTVRVEINFHERYQEYCQHLIGGVGADIVTSKQKMFKTLIKEIIYIAQTQTIISIIIYLILTIFASFFGFGGLVMTIYPVLAAGYLVMYIMYCMIVFMYYFDDRSGAFVTSLVFFVVCLAVSLISTRLTENFYGIGLFAGAFAGWTISFVRLRNIERDIERIIFCKGTIVKKVIAKAGRKEK